MSQDLSGELRIPFANEVLVALDAWTADFANANKTATINSMMEFFDVVDDFIEFDTATPEELSELLNEIGMEAFQQLRRDMQEVGNSLGMLGL